MKTYYWIVADSYIDMDMQHSEDPMAIFSSPGHAGADDVNVQALRRACRVRRLSALFDKSENEAVHQPTAPKSSHRDQRPDDAHGLHCEIRSFSSTRARMTVLAG